MIVLNSRDCHEKFLLLDFCTLLQQAFYQKHQLEYIGTAVVTL